jgi:folate-binding protein YgfZ
MNSSEMADVDPIGYESVQDRAGWFNRSGRVRLEIVGPDRAKFLHNLTTNDVKRLAEGSGHESFVTSPQGKVLAYVTLLSLESSTILLRTDSDSLEALLPHLTKYGVFDDVAIEDASARTFEFHVAGPSSGAILEKLGVELPPEGALRHRSSELAGVAVRIVRESPTDRPGFTLIGPVDEIHPVKSALVKAFVPELNRAAFEALRIEAGTPVSGRDVTLSNLPQEVGRDPLTINFVKGCYLGQETVARLDALGHVNRILKGLKFEQPPYIPADKPLAGSPLAFEGKVVGSVTSAAYSFGWYAKIALGYVRVSQATAGTRLLATIEGVGQVEAFVHDLPMLPPARS